MCIRDRYGIDTIATPQGNYDAVILAVAHREFVDAGAVALRKLGKPSAVLIDIKGTLGIDESDLRI